MSEKTYKAKVCLDKRLEGKSVPFFATYTHKIFADDVVKAIVNLLAMLGAEKAMLSIDDGKTYFVEVKEEKE